MKRSVLVVAIAIERSEPFDNIVGTPEPIVNPNGIRRVVGASVSASNREVA